MEFPCGGELGKIIEFLKGIELDGYEWESLIREYIKSRIPKFEKNIHGDSEGETCVLWTETKGEFLDLMKMMSEIIGSSEGFKELIKK